ncbi:pyridoxamine 5'-phosphate oxidase family protein [Micromonospora sp. HUAS LYJ1]|uniref:pyridoxamine 5'-phosphate oxidase family protein n=1 Tax=Micromonospora sp. HUAS LYJ1 TaxID=3061626 RepID=UPI0026733442|nr:pyridoxamine 5'-phosphate oxidase family protein [Micromonospora sp. HUAS LYJ1]WKU04668.1 pyridoxamine 5'-phosphate oxidase family protein [Micromonospora sp. HUAS LYJ1]
MQQPSVSIAPGSLLGAAISAYRTCELATLAKDGTPVAWPTSGLLRPDGTIMITTSLGYPQKAFNVRRDPRVALLFSDPTASGLTRPEQILVRGTADCPDEVHTEPTGDLGAFWAQMFQRQPVSRGYLDWPATMFTDFYFMRLLITVTPTEVSTRPLPTTTAVTGSAGSAPSGEGLVGAEVLATYPSVVLATLDAGGAPLLVRTTATAGVDGYRVVVPDGLAPVEGPASLLVHQHDAQLWNLHNANVRGELVRDAGAWTLRPRRLIEPAARHQPRRTDSLRTVRSTRAATRRYLRRRGWKRPTIPWAAYRALRPEGSSR